MQGGSWSVLWSKCLQEGAEQWGWTALEEVRANVSSDEP